MVADEHPREIRAPAVWQPTRAMLMLRTARPSTWPVEKGTPWSAVAR
jgi:hypothetical protein